MQGNEAIRAEGRHGCAGHPFGGVEVELRAQMCPKWLPNLELARRSGPGGRLDSGAHEALILGRRTRCRTGCFGAPAAGPTATFGGRSCFWGSGCESATLTRLAAQGASPV